jgi:uncharacterized protein (DUF983 family)
VTAGAPLWRAALLGRCPRCGRGAVFDGLLEIRDRCASCGLDLRDHDAGDGPAVAGVFVIGAVTVGLALWVEARFGPPLWVHAVLWPALVLPATLLLMRLAKAGLVALQWRLRGGGEGRG